MKRQMNRWIAVGTLGVMGIGGMGFVSGTAQAKKSTLYKYGAIAGAGLAGYGLLNHNGRAATVGAVVAAGSYYEYRHNKKKEDRQKRYRHYSRYHHNRRQSAEQRREDWYRRHYGKNWRSHYRAHR